MTMNASDTISDEQTSARSTLGELGNLARSWNHPIDLAQEPKALVVRRPMVGLAAAVALGFMLHGRIARRSR